MILALLLLLAGCAPPWRPGCAHACAREPRERGGPPMTAPVERASEEAPRG